MVGPSASCVESSQVGKRNRLRFYCPSTVAGDPGNRRSGHALDCIGRRRCPHPRRRWAVLAEAHSADASQVRFAPPPQSKNASTGSIQTRVPTLRPGAPGARRPPAPRARRTGASVAPKRVRDGRTRPMTTATTARDAPAPTGAAAARPRARDDGGNAGTSVFLWGNHIFPWSASTQRSPLCAACHFFPVSVQSPYSHRTVSAQSPYVKHTVSVHSLK